MTLYRGTVEGSVQIECGVGKDRDVLVSPIRKTDVRERGVNFATRAHRFVECRKEFYIFSNRQVFVQVFTRGKEPDLRALRFARPRDFVRVELNDARRGTDQARKELPQCAFSGAVGLLHSLEFPLSTFLRSRSRF